jgi:hypothetical protein
MYLLKDKRATLRVARTEQKCRFKKRANHQVGPLRRADIEEGKYKNVSGRSF